MYVCTLVDNVKRICQKRGDAIGIDKAALASQIPSSCNGSSNHATMGQGKPTPRINRQSHLRAPQSETSPRGDTNPTTSQQTMPTTVKPRSVANVAVVKGGASNVEVLRTPTPVIQNHTHRSNSDPTQSTARQPQVREEHLNELYGSIHAEAQAGDDVGEIFAQENKINKRPTMIDDVPNNDQTQHVARRDGAGPRSPSNSGSLKRKRSPISSGLSPARSIPTPRHGNAAHDDGTRRASPVKSMSPTSHGQQRSLEKSRSTSPLSDMSHTPFLSQKSTFGFSDPPSTLDGTTEARAIFVCDSENDNNLDSDSPLEEDPQAPKHESSQVRPRLDTYDSDSSLEDLDVLLGRKKTEAKGPAVSPLNAFRRRAAAASAKAGKSMPIPDFSASFERLVRQSQQEEDAKVKIEAIRKQLETPELKEDSDANDDLDEESLKALLKEEDDPDKAERLQQAMQRTELLHRDPFWHFFDYDKNIEPVVIRPWPKLESDNTTWLGQMKGSNPSMVLRYRRQ